LLAFLLSMFGKTKSPLASLGSSILSFELSSVTSSTASFAGLCASFLRAGVVENLELPDIGWTGINGRKEGDVAAGTRHLCDVVYNLL